MDNHIARLVFSVLTIDQKEELLKEMETMARQKLNSTLDYYMSNRGKADLPADFDQMMSTAQWEDFLPSEYHILKSTLNEKARKAG